MQKNTLSRKGIAFAVIALLIGVSIIPITGSIVEKKSSILTSAGNTCICYHVYRDFAYGDCNIGKRNTQFGQGEILDVLGQKNGDNNGMSITQTNDVHFYGQSNKSIYIVKVSNPYDIILDHLSFENTEKTIGKKSSSGAFLTSCSLFDESIEGGLYPLMEVSKDEIDFQVKLRYLHYKFGEKINYTYENRTLYEFDNETVHSDYLDYPWGPTIPPGTWYFVFSSVIYDLDQTEVSTEWSVRMNFSGNCSDLNISTGEGGKVYGLWYGEFDANVIVSKANMLEMMVNGKASFHIENTFFYWYTSFPITRGIWNVKWVTPDGMKKFNMIILRGRLFYDEDDVEGCIWGMGESGDYELITSYIDYGRTIWGYDIAYFPTFVGLDLKLP